MKRSGTIAKPRAILTEEQAVAIFMLKPSTSDPSSKKSSHDVARTFHVSEKTVRDIWRGRTWHAETKHLDPSRPARNSAPPGRPLGKKDKAPRRGSHGKGTSVVSTAQAIDNTFEDPFHEDWPNWARADSFSGVALPPLIVFTPLCRANSAPIRDALLPDHDAYDVLSLQGGWGRPCDWE